MHGDDDGEEYVPVDLGPLCNAGTDVLGDGHPAPVGRQVFHGLPFQIGPAEGAGPDGTAEGRGPALVLLGGEALNPVSVPIGRSARRVIFVHRLLDTEAFEGGPVGGQVAEYVVRYDGGTEARIPVRERLEIAVLDERWTQRPLLAWMDRDYGLPPRSSGRWEDAGLRQTETSFNWTVSYVLFAWRNPWPERTIRSIEVVPAGPRVVLAAITLGMLDEDALRRDPARDLLVTLPEPSDATAGLDLRVDVDRGVATLTHGITAGGPIAGWGEPTDPEAGRRFVRVSAAPSATLTVRLGEEELGRAGWAELERAGSLAPSPRVRIELVDRGRNWVRSTIVDEESGQPLACRVHFRSARGIPFAPHGHHAPVHSGLASWHSDVGGDVRLGGASYAYTNGTCEGWLPRGEVIAEVAAGFEYEPLRARVTIEPGQQELRLALRRWTDMNARGWYSGDTHVHFLSPQGALMEAQAEGLNVVNLLQAQWGSLFTNTEDFTGAPQVSRDGRTIVYTSQENRQHVMGHLGLLGLKTPIMPWSSDGPGEGEMGGAMETTLADWADRTHAQDGTVIIAHFPSPNGEPAVLIATGRADAVEMIRFGRYEHLTWYRYLNAGYRLPLVGGTDKMSSDVPVGLYRTYVRIPPDEEFTYESWCRNLRLGRTFQSGGPIIGFSVDGHEVGDSISLPAGGGTVEVEAWAESIFPVHQLEVVHDGQVVAATSAEAGARRLALRGTVRVGSSGWLAARVGGPAYWNPTRHQDEWGRGIMAHTSPVYVAVGEGPWRRHDEATSRYMLTLVTGALEYVREMSPQHPAGTVTHHHGETDHRAYLERPFHEAIAAIRARMEEPPRERH